MNSVPDTGSFFPSLVNNQSLKHVVLFESVNETRLEHRSVPIEPRSVFAIIVKAGIDSLDSAGYTENTDLLPASDICNCRRPWRSREGHSRKGGQLWGTKPDSDDARFVTSCEVEGFDGHFEGVQMSCHHYRG